MRPLLSLAALAGLGAAIPSAPAGAAFPRDRTPRVPVEPAGSVWSRPFSVVAGGGMERPRDGV
ncbi:MAG TPA: hypothetical protein VNT55_15860, partial [Baekduia sp.]|nr:hypothetical protein [Baekduia sp.]